MHPAGPVRQGGDDSAVKVARCRSAQPAEPAHPRVHELRSRLRRERGRFTFEGPTMLAEARRSGIAIEEMYGTDAALETHAGAIAELESAGVPVFAVPERRSRASPTWRPRPGSAVAFRPEHRAAILARPGLVLLLAAVSDPGNAGTLLRSAEAFGAAGALCGQGGADPYAPKVVRAAMGSLFRLPVATVGAERRWRRPPRRAADRRRAPRMAKRWPERRSLPTRSWRSGTSATAWAPSYRAGTAPSASSKQARPRASTPPSPAASCSMRPPLASAGRTLTGEK